MNLNICARNPMMYLRKARHAEICVLSVSTAVLDLPGVVVADQNVASDYARFAAAPDGLAIIDAEMTFARNWKHPEDQLAEWRHKAMKCAEVLVPHQVAPDYIQCAYVSCSKAENALRELGIGVNIAHARDLFFL